MRQNMLKNLAPKILANFFILTVVIAVFYFIGQTHKSPQAQAAEPPRCGLANNTCAIGTTDGTYHFEDPCWKWGCVVGDVTTPCSQCENACGNGNVDIGEDCDGTNLNNQTCITQGYDRGALGCDADCFFNIDNCTSCGNGTIDKPTEQCEGTNLDGQTCETQGYAGGTLKCSSADCIFDTSLCTPAVCGNGVKEGGEQCDGFDFGGQDCASFKCTGGSLSCFGCVLNKDACTGCPTTPTTGCASTIFSDWSAPADCSKGCCGSASDTYLDSLTKDSKTLCSGGKIATNFVLSNNAIWSWDCGITTNCFAFMKAQCADISGLASKLECKPSVLYESKKDWENALAKSSLGLCKGGFAQVGGDGQTFDPCSYDHALNKIWTCSGADTSKSSVVCGVGWAPDSTCGTANKATYRTGTGLCASDATWNKFFGLVNQNDNPELCGPGSRVYLPNSSQYSMEGGDTGDFSGFDNNATKYFDWRCRYDVSGSDRKGKPINCQATLDSSCSGGDAVCGPATSKKFSGTGAGPQTGFCKTGKLGGSILEKVTYDSNAHRWSWTCLPQDNKNKSVNCSVTATVWCGAAGTSNQEYATREAVRAAGTCTGISGELFPKGAALSQQIKDNTTNWEWICVDSTDATVFADCKASNGKCGHAGGLVLSQYNFDNGKGNAGFLCSDGTIPTPGFVYNNARKVEEWTWKCGSLDCSATKLSCGWANGNKYFKNSFDSQSSFSGTFLCSKPNGMTTMSYTDDLDEAHATSQATWTWVCAGDDGSAIGGCTADRYSCGWANNHKVAKFYDVNAPNNGTSGWNGTGANSEFCTYDAVRGDLNSGETGASWTCKDPNSPSQYEVCTTDYATCGSVTNYHNTYYPQTKKYYYKSTLESSAFQLTSSLCINHSSVGAITDNGSTLSWSCADDFGFSSPTCEVNKIDCGFGQGSSYLSRTNPWNLCVNPFNGSNTCLCKGGNNDAVDSINPKLLTPLLRDTSDPLLQKADWYCLDDYGSRGVTNELGNACWATCYNCK